MPLWIEANAAECEVRLGRWERARERLAGLLSLRANGDDVRLAVLAGVLVLAARRGEEPDTADREAEALALVQAKRLARRGRGRLLGAGRARLDARAPAARARARGRRPRAVALRRPAVLDLDALPRPARRGRPRCPQPSDAREPARATARALRDETHWYAYVEPAGARAPPETLLHWDVADAELARLDEDWRPDAWTEIARRFDAIGQPYQGVYARVREAEARLALDQRAPGAQALRDAHATASRARRRGSATTSV